MVGPAYHIGNIKPFQPGGVDYMNREIKGTIFNIQKFSVQDGPGIRTTVFFKGCNLRCVWCHNPESISLRPQLEFYPRNCIGCGKCFEVCPEDVHYFDPIDGRHKLRREDCTGCFTCVSHCYAEAIVGVGRRITAGEVMDSILLDKMYYDQSGGGATFSGGECMLQQDFLAELLTGCHEHAIHTAVDTAGNVEWEWFERVLPVTDLFLYDLKAADSDVHKKLTGSANNRILANLRRLSELGKRIIIRIPFVPGYNDGELAGMREILAPLSVEKVEVLPYHKLGVSKYEALDIKDPSLDAEVPSDQTLDEAVAFLRESGINAVRT